MHIFDKKLRETLEKSMPLPWKKTKVARISRLVADLHSPKRGGSLVVQTGFPTSLVDLFVKNRDRLKKQSKNKSRPQQTHSQIEISDPILMGPVLPVDSTARNEIATATPTTTTTTHVRVVEEFDGGGGGKSVFLVASLKMFVVMVLALSTKRLAVGVTMSAILLLLLEYVGVDGSFCSTATTWLVSFLGRIKFNKSNLDVKCLGKSEICEEISGNSSCDMVSDIGRLEEEIQVEETRIGRYLDMEEEQVKIKDVLASSYNDGSRAGGCKFKEKLVRRLVPKKLKKKWKKNQVESSQGENKLRRLLEQEQDDENESSIVSLKEERDPAGLVCYDEVTKCQEIKQNSSGYLILILIVLAGLVGGRIVALVLILAWFLILKLTRSTFFSSVSY